MSNTLMMTWVDGVIAPFYFLFFLLIGYFFSRSRYANSTISKLFLWGLVIKLLACVAFALIYQFYYGGGDTNLFFKQSLLLNNVLYKDPIAYFKILLGSDVSLYQPVFPVLSKLGMANDSSSFVVVKFSSLFALFCFRSYLPIALTFGFLSFVGTWAMYRVFVKIFPSLFMPLAFAVLFFPSIFFWSSSLMKDSITFGFLGLLLYTSYNIFIIRRRFFFSVLLFIISAYIIFLTKQYIIFAFFPALLFWTIFEYQSQIKQKVLKVLVYPLALILLVLGGYFSLIFLGANIEELLEESEKTAIYLTYISEIQGGSGYDLGDIEYTPTGLLKAFPKAVNVTLFRPYIFEANNPVFFLSSLEGMVLIILFFTGLFRQRVFGVFSLFRANPFLQFCLLFTLIFAFAVGVSTWNFGSLVRYKIPCLPFFGCILVLMNAKKGSLNSSGSKKVTLQTD